MTAATEAGTELAAALGVLRRRGLVCYPTETVYGLAADSASPDALEALVKLKGRGRAEAFSLLVSDLGMAARLTDGPAPSMAVRLAEAFWPGPLTIVVPARSSLHPSLVGRRGGVGLRCSADPSAAALVAAFARPLTSTSANPGGKAPAESATQARGYFASSVGCYLDGGLRSSGSVSTVVEVVSGAVRLLRRGAISEQVLARQVRLED